MSTNSSSTSDSPKRPRRSPGKLRPAPKGVAVLTRIEAAAFLGISFTTLGVWEREGRLAIPRYRLTSGSGRIMVYPAADLARLKEEFRKLDEPHPDPERAGVIRVPIRTHRERLFAIIDAEDLPKVQGKNWNVRAEGPGRKAEVILSSITERVVPLKRIIMGVDKIECKDQLVDYVNGDPFDCRRSNLVIKTWTQSVLSRPKMTVRAGRATLTKYKGVRWDGIRRLWLAQIGSGEKHRMLGRFRDEHQAAAAYDAAARELFGDAAVLNFPDGVVPAPTFLSPDGEPVREKNAYSVARGLPKPPDGVPMLTRDEAAAMLEVSEGTFTQWERAGDVPFTRYRAKDTTGTPILYAAADIARLREELDKVGQPYPDPHPERAGVIRVPLRTLNGYIEALIDEVDLPIVRGKKWNYSVRSGKSYDKAVVVQVGPRNAPHQQLKRLILALGDEQARTQIVHANGNPLDCRRANLVLHSTEKSTRACFKHLHRCGRPTTSRFKGVYWNERAGGWQSQIRIGDQTTKLGLFDDEEDAALAYDEAAREAWGAEARVNFPVEGELPSAAAPVSPGELWEDGPTARAPGKPTDLSAALNPDGSVTLSWRSANAAASAGVSFAVSRKLPGQTAFVRIATVGGTTAGIRRPSFTDTTVPAADLFAGTDGAGVEYVVQPLRGTAEFQPSDALAVKFESPVTVLTSQARAQAA